LIDFHLKCAVTSIALATASMASAQHAGHMPGMTMPTAKKPVVKPTAKKPAVEKPTVKKPAVKKPARKPLAKPAAKPAPSGDHHRMDMSSPTVTTPPVDQIQTDHGQPATATPPPVDHSQMDHSQPAADAAAADHGAMAGMDHAVAGHAAMRGALGAYPSTREASGTAWQPDSSEHRGYMARSGAWDLMLHGQLDLVGDTQSGRRGDSKIFPAGMLMGMATRRFANGDALQFKAMVSPDPLMGKSGYPLLLASGETADGETRLIDRQHPHDLVMELSASYALKLGAKSSAFVYAGLPGEPAFGPPAFMHRQSISVSPEAPITHHWLDSTHITFGVVTAGLVLDRLKLEASRFNGREPDQHRYNIETGPLDSTALRLSWNPTHQLSLQGSWAHLEEPEQLEPGVDQKRWSASAAYTRPTANGWWASSLAWGRKSIDGKAQDAWALESSVKRGAWTLFGRGEITENNELVELDHHDDEHHGEVFRVGKASLGLARDVDLAGPVGITVGALASVNFIPEGLRAEYGRKHPLGAMAFVRLRLD
jgi:hypothetical protein